MEEADLRHSRTNVRRQKVIATPVNDEAQALPWLGRDCVARRLQGPTAQAAPGAEARLPRAPLGPIQTWLGGPCE